MEIPVSLPHLKMPATRPCPEQDQSMSCPHPTYLRSILIPFCHLLLGLSGGLFPSSFPTKFPFALLLFPIRVTCSTHIIFLDLITHIVFGEKNISQNFSFYNLSHSLFLSLCGPKCLPQHPILEHPQHMLLPQCETPNVSHP